MYTRLHKREMWNMHDHNMHLNIDAVIIAERLGSSNSRLHMTLLQPLIATISFDAAWLDLCEMSKEALLSPQCWIRSELDTNLT